MSQISDLKPIVWRGAHVPQRMDSINVVANIYYNFTLVPLPKKPMATYLGAYTLGIEEYSLLGLLDTDL